MQEGTPRGYGGYSEVARYLSETFDDESVTRQCVYMWHSRRDANGFPQVSEVVDKTTGRTILAFSLEETRKWLEAYRSTRLSRRTGKRAS